MIILLLAAATAGAGLFLDGLLYQQWGATRGNVKLPRSMTSRFLLCGNYCVMAECGDGEHGVMNDSWGVLAAMGEKEVRGEMSEKEG